MDRVNSDITKIQNQDTGGLRQNSRPLSRPVDRLVLVRRHCTPVISILVSILSTMLIHMATRPVGNVRYEHSPVDITLLQALNVFREPWGLLAHQSAFGCLWGRGSCPLDYSLGMRAFVMEGRARRSLCMLTERRRGARWNQA